MPDSTGGHTIEAGTNPADKIAIFDFRKRVAYDSGAKRLFHRRARRQLIELATALNFDPADYDLRSNEGGIAVSGEITFHADRLYVQVSQPATRADTGILFRTCEGRRDYTGGRNNFASLDLLHPLRLLPPDTPIDVATISRRSICCTGRRSSPA